MRLPSRFAIFFLGTLCIASASFGKDLDTSIVRSNRSLSSAQFDALQNFADEKTQQLSRGESRTMVAARNELIKHARSTSATPIFLQAYSQALLTNLGTLINGDESIRAENALRVAAFLRTPRATELIVLAVHPNNTDDATRRLVAAGLLSTSVADTTSSGLNSAELATIARGIANAVAQETSWHVALQDLRALGVIASSSQLAGANRTVVRDLQFGSFASLVSRVAASNEPSPLIHAIYRALLDLRPRLIAAGTDSSSPALAGSLRTSLSKIGAASIKQWTGLSADSSAKKAYEGTLRIGAQVLSLLDGKPDSKAAALAKAMERGKEDLQTALARFSGR